MRPEVKTEIMALCCGYVKPENIKRLFDIPYYQQIYHIKANGLEGWQLQTSRRRNEWRERFKEQEDYEKEHRIALAIELLTRENGKSNNT